MKKVLFAAAIALFASTEAFAIIGAGAHYVINTGSLKGSSGDVPIVLTIQNPITESPEDISTNIKVTQKKADGLQGLGFKGWIDFLPFVDIEGTFNVAATRYETILSIPTPTQDGTVEYENISLTYSPDAPYNMLFDKASPLYGIFTGDISVTYPITSLPIIRPYAGVGFSYLASIPLVNSDFTKKMIENAPELVSALAVDPADPSAQTAAAEAADAIGKALVKTLKESEYKTGMGGHIIAGFRLKLPIIPLALYANGKYYIGGDLGSQFSQGFVFELGGGLAI
jgi:hypothetical protein